MTIVGYDVIHYPWLYVADARLVPIDLDEARDFIRSHHRHNPDMTGWRVGVGLATGGELRGVAVLSRPVAIKVARDPFTCEIIRVCTLGDKNANSRLYGAACRVAKNLGYDTAITYTRPDESGASLLAAGFLRDEGIYGSREGQEWHPNEPKQDSLFGEPKRDTSGPKYRWRRRLTPGRRSTTAEPSPAMPDSPSGGSTGEQT